MMRSTFILAASANLAAALWPIPTTYTSGDDVLWIDRNVKINYRVADSVGDVLPHS